MLHMDASIQGLGAILYQGVVKDQHILTYSSQSLVLAETCYPVMELEALAIIWAIKHYLYGRPFMVVTDHHGLCYMHHLKNPCNCIIWWVMKLQEYDFQVIYKFRKEHLAPDCLPHQPQELCKGNINGDSDAFISMVMAGVDMWEE